MDYLHAEFRRKQLFDMTAATTEVTVLSALLSPRWQIPDNQTTWRNRFFLSAVSLQDAHCTHTLWLYTRSSSEVFSSTLTVWTVGALTFYPPTCISVWHLPQSTIEYTNLLPSPHSKIGEAANNVSEHELILSMVKAALVTVMGLSAMDCGHWSALLRKFWGILAFPFWPGTWKQHFPEHPLL